MSSDQRTIDRALILIANVKIPQAEEISLIPEWGTEASTAPTEAKTLENLYQIHKIQSDVRLSQRLLTRPLNRYIKNIAWERHYV